MKYEYKVLRLAVKEMEKVFNEWAKEGWRVISVSPNVAIGYGVVCTLERPLEEEKQEPQNAE